MSAPLKVTGQLSQKDAQRLTRQSRASTIGPTTLYYAGVTAPIIGAAMALLGREAFSLAGMNMYWVTLFSALMAAMAGIVWYLIFVRWSYRQRHGRTDELEKPATLVLNGDHICVQRDLIEMRIGWDALKSIDEKKRYTLLKFEGTRPIMIPASWFGKDKTARQAFIARLKQGKLNEWHVDENQT